MFAFFKTFFQTINTNEVVVQMSLQFRNETSSLEGNESTMVS
jgi:hypothetical protein